MAKLLCALATTLLVAAASVVAQAEPAAEPESAGQGARLVGGFSPANGRLELAVDGAWATVCRSPFDALMPWVACTQLGVGEMGYAYSSDFFGQGPGPLFVHGISCRGTEERLEECPRGPVNTTACPPGNTTSITCSALVTDGFEAGPEGRANLNSAIIQGARLFGGTTNECGLVEVQVNGSWGGVCTKGFDAKALEVFCDQLGLQSDPTDSSTFGYDYSFGSSDSGLVWIDELDCTGNETSLGQCGFLGWNISDCPQQVTAHCYNASELAANPERLSCSVDWWHGKQIEEVRLVNGSAPTNGRLEVLINGTWGSACHLGNEEVATVVCRSLGLGDWGSIHPDLRYSARYPPAWMNNVTCAGEEAQLQDCSMERVNPFESYTGYSCDQMLIVCSDAYNESAGNPLLPPPIEGVRLANGTTPNTGFLEVKSRGEWGSVSVYGLDGPAGRVACRQLGFPGIAGPPDSGSFQAANYTPGLFANDQKEYHWNVTCSGQEASLAECLFAEFTERGGSYSYGYSSYNPAFLVCAPPQGWTLDDLKLVNSSDAGELIRSQGGAANSNITEGPLGVWTAPGARWGAISNASFGQNEAIVACRTLFFPDSSKASVWSDPEGYASTAWAWIRQIRCTGKEERIKDCQIAWCDETCGTQMSAAGVECA